MEFGILGPLEVIIDDRVVDVNDRRQRRLLAVLLVNFGRTVSAQYLVDTVWDDQAPATVRRQLQNCVSALRRSLAGDGSRAPALVTGNDGYRIRAESTRLDAAIFTEQVQRARSLAAAGPSADAVGVLRSALLLWRGPALAGLGGRAIEAAAARLEEQRLAAIEDCVDLELQLGRRAELVTELSELAAANPLRERLVGQLMKALHGSDRRVEALNAYQRVRASLVRELGLDPSAALQRLHLAILTDDPSVGASRDARETGGGDTADAPVAVPPVVAPVVPAQLPPDVPAFTGRANHLKTLGELLPDDSGVGATSVAVSVIVGMAGVGKTSLAVHWGHMVRDRFPDGQLYLNLRGYGTDLAVRPAEALTHMLRSLGVPAEQIPADMQTAAGQYRSMLADARMLVVLDNAATADQVRPLLPAGPGCVVLVTSRDRLPGLVAQDGARGLTVDVLTPDEAHTLLTRILGPERVAAELEAVAELARACSYLPLAVRLAAANLVTNPWPSIAAQVAALHDGDRLHGLEIDGDEQAGVRHAFDLSYLALDPCSQRMFRLFGLVPGLDLTARTAAALAGTTTAEAAARLARLAVTHLLYEHAPGRFTSHDLLRRYAGGRANHDEPETERINACGRLDDWYLDRADRAARLLYPHRLRLPIPALDARPPAADADVLDDAALDDAAAALAWLDDERANLVSTVRNAAGRGRLELAWLLTDTLRGYFWLRMHTADWREAADYALSAATAAGDLRAQAQIRLSMGDLFYRRNDYGQALTQYAASLDAYERSGWLEGQIAALGNLGVSHREAGSLPEAASYLDQALVVCRASGSRYSEAITLNCLGNTYWQLGRLADAATACTEAVALNRELGSRLGEAAALGDLGEVLRAQGSLDEALERFTEALRILRELGDLSNEACVLSGVAAVHCQAGRLDEAAGPALSAVSLARDVGDDRLLADALNTLGTVRRRSGRHRVALEHHQRAFDLSVATGVRYTEAESLIGLAAALVQLEQYPRALEEASRAVAIAADVGFGGLREHAEAIVRQIRSVPAAG